MNDTIRLLSADEIAQLERQGNTATMWHLFFVTDPFDLSLLRNNHFEGPTLLGSLTPGNVQNDDGYSLPEGISNCWMRNSAAGDHCALHNVQLIDRCSLGDHVMMFNVGELSKNDNMLPLAPMNENGGRSILPTPDMTVADAYLWARYRDRKVLMQKLEQISKRSFRNGGHLTVGDYATIRHCKRLHNVWVLSSQKAPSHIEECLHLSNGIVNYGCRLQDGIIAKNFLLGEQVKLQYGLRLNDSVVGDNSTLARCEVGNSIIFPAHEQHHNNSFLIAALIEGQSNLAAGATVGSNHNSRAADGELHACRGFWPGLCTSLKHNSRFAAFCLLAKCDYPAELDIPYPLALVNNNSAKDQLEVMPAYWWLYNMYALKKFETKFRNRDRRVLKRQHIDLGLWAPDLAEQMWQARASLAALLRQAGINPSDYHPASNGSWPVAQTPKGIEITVSDMEQGKRRQVLLKPVEAYQAYTRMIYHYAVRTLKEYVGNKGVAAFDGLPLDEPRQRHWVNLGGQLLPQQQVDELIEAIEQSKLTNWNAINARTRRFAKARPTLWAAHAYLLLCEMEGIEGHAAKQTTAIDGARWQKLLAMEEETEAFISEQSRLSRQKDADNPFRQAVYYTPEEQQAVLD